jgi:RimJ/RimL family protein N-acetyltransferase
MKEKGIGGIYVHPFPLNHVWDEEQFLKNILQKWSHEPFAPNWEISWVAEINGVMAGHLNLRCGSIPAAIHRMRMGLGIETQYRSLGIGRALMQAAVEWAKSEEKVQWIDLSVFSRNHVAIGLYEKFGFQKIYEIEDALRVDGEIIHDIQMTLKV